MFTPRYSWNIANFGVKHQSINHKILLTFSALDGLPPSSWSSNMTFVYTFYLHLQWRVLAWISQEKLKIRSNAETPKFFCWLSHVLMYEQWGEIFFSILPLNYLLFFFAEIFTSLMIVDNPCHQGHLKIRSKEISEVKCQRWEKQFSVSIMYYIWYLIKLLVKFQLSVSDIHHLWKKLNYNNSEEYNPIWVNFQNG